MNTHSSTIRKIHTGWHRIGKSISHYLRKHCNNCSIQNWPEFTYSEDEHHLHARMNKPVVLWNWPYKSNSGKRCHIVINGDFTCHADTNSDIELLSYCTQIGYFKPKIPSEPRTVTPIDGYHFDMEKITPRAHPVFHAQRHEKVLLDELSSINLELGSAPPKPTLHHVHLPTPQIDLVSALIMIIADHIVCDGETENGFFKLACDARMHLPLKANLGRQARLERCINQQEMLLDHWYAPTAP